MMNPLINKKGLIGILMLFTSGSILAQTSVLIDINPGTDDGYADYLTVSDSLMFFVAQKERDGVDYEELYVTDGTTRGTVKVSNLSTHDNRSTIEFLTAFNGGVLFTADTDEYGRELYYSDGTSSGTHLVKDINPDDEYSDPDYITVMGDKAYFAAEDGRFPEQDNGSELWVTNGSSSGTYLLKDINPGQYEYDLSYPPDTVNYDSDPSRLFAYEGKLYFTARTKDNGDEPWVSDGTENGTHLIKDLYTGLDEYDHPQSSDPNSYFGVNGYVLFVAEIDTTDIPRLIATDGTGAGTKVVASFEDRPAGTNLDGKPVMYNGAAYFIRNAAIWKTDGTEAGTEMMVDLIDITFDEDYSDINEYLIPYKGELYFFSDYALWKTDGTDSGTIELINSTFKMPYNSHYRDLARVKDDNIYFFATDNAYGLPQEYGEELWVTDGTAAGTMVVRDLKTGTQFGDEAQGSEPEQLRLFKNHLYFIGDSDEFGEEIWKSDGIPERTAVVVDTSDIVDFSELDLKIEFTNIDTTLNVSAYKIFNADTNVLSLPDTTSLPTRNTWKLTADTSGVFTASVCITLNDSIDTDPDEGYLSLYKRDHASTPWLKLDSEINTNTENQMICANGVQSFSEFAVVKVTETIGVGLNGQKDYPDRYSLNQNYPNPFNPITTISYTIPETSKVTLAVFTIIGKKVATLVQTEQTAGTHSVTFNGAGFASGMYIYRLKAGDFVSTRKLMLIK